jgi:hypothetical protein
VDCIATVRIPHCFSQSAIAFSSPGGTSEAPYRLLVPARRYSYIVGFVADINAGGIWMYYLQADIFTLDLPHHLAPLLAVHLIPMAAR